jgi:hypothetical protein
MAIDPLALVFGSKPQVAKPKLTSLPASQTQAVGANIAAFPGIEQLGTQYSDYLTQQLSSLIPNYRDILSQGGAVTGDIQSQAAKLAEGQIPQDVLDQINQSTAYESLISGTAGSGMSQALNAKTLGLTSLDLINQGANLNTSAENAAQGWARIAGSTAYNPAAMFITPAQQEAVTAQNNALMQAYQQYKYNVAAAPDPGAAGISNTIMGLVGAYLGTVGGGGAKGAIGGGGGGGGVVQGGQTPYTNFGIDMNQGVGSGAGYNVASTSTYDPNTFDWGSYLSSPDQNSFLVGNEDPLATLYGGFAPTGGG